MDNIEKAKGKNLREPFMKIAIDISQAVYGTGVSNYTKYLVEHLLKADKKNQYLLFGSSLRAYKKLGEFKKNLSQYPNVEFKFLHYPPTIMEPMLNKFRIFPIEKFIGEVDILHSSDWTQPSVKNKNTKKITTIHDMVPYLFSSSVHPKIVKTFKRKMQLVKKEVDLILADSQTTKEDIIKFLEIPEEKIKVVYLATPPDFKSQDQDKVNAVLEKYKIKKPYILSVATQEPRKNIQKIIDVFGEIQKRRPNVHLVLTGKYGWGPGFRSAENVIWTDYVSQEDLIALYSGCRVFIYPSLYEGFGLPILEAMACGAPVITSNNSSMAEIAKDAAILVDPRSHAQLTRAIEIILDLNLDNYQKMVRASLDRARSYTWDKTARQTLDAYQLLEKQIEIEKESAKQETETAAAGDQESPTEPDYQIKEHKLPKEIDISPDTSEVESTEKVDN